MPAGFMQIRAILTIGFLVISAFFASYGENAQQVPHLVGMDGRTQLFVDGKPFLILGGELMNSSPASAENMRPAWPRLAALHLNTVLAGVSWELVEPEEGHFDFTDVDEIIKDARTNHLHIVFLWFASWKNGMSSYVPLWVKKNPQRFPRARGRSGQTLDVLSPMPGVASQTADARAFAALMRHIREVDGATHTVLMMQVENEVGILDNTRDFSPLANSNYGRQVPATFMKYLLLHKDDLSEAVRDAWQESGYLTSGTWPEVFGAGQYGDEIFMAWNYANYVESVVAAGKAEYNIPMYVNAWQAQPQYPRPGNYPSGGPNYRNLDIWRAAGTSIDFYSPDVYAHEFESGLKGYRRASNPLFIPEAEPGDPAAYNAFLAFGEGAFGFSPFGIDHWEEPNTQLASAYELIDRIKPLLLEDRPGRVMEGFSLSPERPKVTLQMGGLDLVIALDDAYYSHAKRGGGIIVMDDPNHFWAIGRGFMVTFTPANGTGSIGIAAADKDSCLDGICKPFLQLNGDETNQGRSWRFQDNEFAVGRISLYRY
jgi:hypothetical protein